MPNPILNAPSCHPFLLIYTGCEANRPKLILPSSPLPCALIHSLFLRCAQFHFSHPFTPLLLSLSTANSSWHIKPCKDLFRSAINTCRPFSTMKGCPKAKSRRMHGFEHISLLLLPSSHPFLEAYVRANFRLSWTELGIFLVPPFIAWSPFNPFLVTSDLRKSESISLMRSTSNIILYVGLTRVKRSDTFSIYATSTTLIYCEGPSIPSDEQSFKIIPSGCNQTGCRSLSDSINLVIRVYKLF
jgi:hypothetical protein